MLNQHLSVKLKVMGQTFNTKLFGTGVFFFVFFFLTENAFVLDDNQEYPLCGFGGSAPSFHKIPCITETSL